MDGFRNLKSLRGAPEKRCNLTSNEGINCLGERLFQLRRNAGGATTTVEIACGLVVLSHEVDTEEVM
jgi:hypothetical protein